MTFTALASSSTGNAYIVSDSKTRLLIEAGLAHKTLQTLLGFRIAELDGCLISHEHKDHAKAALEVIKDGIPVYMSEGGIKCHWGGCVRLHGAVFHWQHGSGSLCGFSRLRRASGLSDSKPSGR